MSDEEFRGMFLLIGTLILFIVIVVLAGWIWAFAFLGTLLFMFGALPSNKKDGR